MVRTERAVYVISHTTRNMNVLVAVVAAGVLVVYLYTFLRSYVKGNDGLNRELFD